MKIEGLEGFDILHHYITGSTLYRCNEDDSDIDTKGIYMAPLRHLFGVGNTEGARNKWGDNADLYKPQVGDKRHDNTLYELGKYMSMLLTSNPTVIEGLFVPEDMMLVQPHKCLEILFANRNQFVTKDCFDAFTKYSLEQIKKARGLNKKIVNPMTERKGVMDFIYTTYKQGSMKMSDWLSCRNMKQEYCGLVNIPNMQGIYGVYYDWGTHFKEEGVTIDTMANVFQKNYGKPTRSLSYLYKVMAKAEDDGMKIAIMKDIHEVADTNMLNFILYKYQLDAGVYEVTLENLLKWCGSVGVRGYKGIVGKDSTEVRLSSVAKGEIPICYISYNKDGFSSHCADYREYKLWEKERNAKRYESNLDKTYDSKNMYHCVRLIHMGIEIANGDGVILDRREAGDRDLLMAIRKHEYEYDELLSMVEEDEKRLKEAISKSTIPEKIDVNAVNDMLIEIRRKFYGI